MRIDVIISQGRGRSNLCDRAPSGLPASSNFYAPKIRNFFPEGFAYWIGGFDGYCCAIFRWWP
ncbi:hypothetical protein EAJ18_11475 [Citrobacter amalonaticus]|uniref:Uncharacterized protein n=1 Tax=Citrobacter amalonaticus TaxID=35703 RepID=A0ABY0HUK7_CITAM|nr:hypothetical protein EAJ18_11475 [Citrobacter amalonaticus]